jgi:hypothetical protein
MSPNDYISVRDWRRKPPMSLRVTKKLDIHWCWIKCTRCPHMRAVAIAPVGVMPKTPHPAEQDRETQKCVRLDALSSKVPCVSPRGPSQCRTSPTKNPTPASPMSAPRGSESV